MMAVAAPMVVTVCTCYGKRRQGELDGGQLGQCNQCGWECNTGECNARECNTGEWNAGSSGATCGRARWPVCHHRHRHHHRQQETHGAVPVAGLRRRISMAHLPGLSAVHDPCRLRDAHAGVHLVRHARPHQRGTALVAGHGPQWTAVALPIAMFIAGCIGGWLALKVTRKHFERAGLV